MPMFMIQDEVERPKDGDTVDPSSTEENQDSGTATIPSVDENPLQTPQTQLDTPIGETQVATPVSNVKVIYILSLSFTYLIF